MCSIKTKEGAKSLPKNAVLISYLVNENHVLAFTLQANGKLTAHDLGLEELSALKQIFRDAPIYKQEEATE
ncbi:MAG: hypothetical protein ABFS56_35065 [Pseudomonadota bacterium]